MLSLSSPRMASLPHAVDLLSLMSLLSDGISDIDLTQSKSPIAEILKCKITLVRTSLAYVDHAGQLKVLAPIREYIQNARPPSPELVRPVRKYLIDLLKLGGNLHNLLRHGLDCDQVDLGEMVHGVILLSRLNLNMNLGHTSLMLRLPAILTRLNDHRLHGLFITQSFQVELYTTANAEKAMSEAIEHFHIIKDIEGEARLYQTVAKYYSLFVRDQTKAQTFYGRALSLASECHSEIIRVHTLNGLAAIELFHGNHLKGLQLARKAYRLAVAAGSIWGEIYSLKWQAMCYGELGDFKQSLQRAKKARELMMSAGMQGGYLHAHLSNIEAEAYYRKTEYAEAQKIYGVVLHQTSAMLSPVSYAYALISIVSLDLATGASTDIVSHNLQAAETIFRKVQFMRGISLCEVHTADLKFREGDKTSACIVYMRAFSSAYSTDNELACYCLEKLADSTYPVHCAAEVRKWAVVFLAFQDMNEEALPILTVALEGFTLMDVHKSRAECMQTIGDVHFHQLLFERSLQEQAIVEIDVRLAQELDKCHEANLVQVSNLSRVQCTSTATVNCSVGSGALCTRLEQSK
ncbi:hypothetical protein B0H14DRAFT_2903063 [Mycena olivaceomarginata]|nr:hypothetical protein B0H14DRAFT_2903063 [Mycena olivaceomarginata]